MNDEKGYAARKPDYPGFVAWMSGDDRGDRKQRKRIADEVARWIRAGWAVERVTVEQARDGLGEYLGERKRREGQMDLIR